MSSVVTPISATQAAQQEDQARVEPYWKRCLIAFDQLCNVVFFKGHPDETISAHSARAANQGKAWGIGMCWFLNLFQSNHGVKAEAGDLERAKIVTGLEEDSGDLPK